MTKQGSSRLKFESRTVSTCGLDSDNGNNDGTKIASALSPGIHPKCRRRPCQEATNQNIPTSRSAKQITLPKAMKNAASRFRGGTARLGDGQQGERRRQQIRFRTRQEGYPRVFGKRRSQGWFCCIPPICSSTIGFGKKSGSDPQAEREHAGH